MLHLTKGGYFASGSGSQNNRMLPPAPPLKNDRAEVSEVLNERAIQELPIDRTLPPCSAHPRYPTLSFNILGPENPQGGLALNSNGSNYAFKAFCWMELKTATRC